MSSFTGSISQQPLAFDPDNQHFYLGASTGAGFLGQEQRGTVEVPEAAVITRDFTTGKLSLLDLQENANDQNYTAFVAAYDLDITLLPAL